MPSKAFVTGSLQLWESRRAKAASDVRRADRMITKRRRQLAALNAAASTSNAAAPRIVGWDMTGITPAGVFGPLGQEMKVTTHYAASGRAETLQEGIQLTRSFDVYHRKYKNAQGQSAGLSYHYLIPDTGELILGRSTYHLGAHVYKGNTGNVGVNFFCTKGHEPTRAQARTFMWLLANAHTDALPQRHRTDRDLRTADIRGHRDWPLQSTDCPDRFSPANLRRIAG